MARYQRPAQPRHPNDAVVYCRVSTDPQERKGTSLTTQAEACVRHAQTNGWNVVEVIQDTVSGGTLDRSGLDRVRELWASGSVGVVLAYAVDRLSRDQLQLAVLMGEATRHGVRLQFVTEEFEDSMMGRLVLMIRGWGAELERANIRERFMRGKRGRLRSGRLVRPPLDLYGYTTDKESGHRTIHEPTAAVVRRIYEAIAARAGTVPTAQHLNEEGIASPARGKRAGCETAQWSQATVWGIVRNPAYMGVTITNRWQGDGYGFVTPRPREEWVTLPDGVTPPIVTPALWQAAQDALADNRLFANRNARRFYLLRGLVRCGGCGQPWYGGAKGRYYCASKNRKGSTCRVLSVLAAPFEVALWEQVAQTLSDPALVTAAVAALRQQAAEQGGDAGVADTEAATLRRAVAEVEERQVRTIDAQIAAAGIAGEAFAERLRSLDRERRQLVDRLAMLDARTAARRSAVVAPFNVAAWCARWQQNLARLDAAGKRLALESLGIVVTMTAAEAVVEGVIPTGSSVGLQSYSRSRTNRTTGSGGAAFRFAFDRTIA